MSRRIILLALLVVLAGCGLSRLRFDAFDHQMADLSHRIAEELAAARSDMLPERYGQHANTLERLATEGEAWLAANRPDPCFAAAHATFQAWFDRMLEYAVAVRRVQEKPSPEAMSALSELAAQDKIERERVDQSMSFASRGCG